MDKEWVEVDVLGVGQGACNVICHIREDDSGERELLCMGMVDCGSDDMTPSDAVLNYIRDNMALRKKSQSIWTYPSDYYLDFLIVTHQDKDHLSWLEAVFDGISAPPYLKKGTDEELYSELVESMTISDPDPNCRMVDLSRNLRAEYFPFGESERLINGRCEEHGNLEVNYSQEGFELMGMVKTKGVEYIGKTERYYSCCLQGNGPFLLSYFIYLSPHYSKLFLDVLCGVSWSDNPFDYGDIQVEIRNDWVTGECNYSANFWATSCIGYKNEFLTEGSFYGKNAQETMNGAFAAIETDLEALEDMNPVQQDGMQRSLEIIKRIILKQTGGDSLLFYYNNPEDVESRIVGQKASTGVIGLLVFGGALDPHGGDFNKPSGDGGATGITQAAYGAVGSLALKELRPYGANKIIYQDFGGLELALFPYTTAFLNGLRSKIKNGSSVISVVKYNGPEEKAVFTGDAILESMQEFNNFNKIRSFSNPQLMTAPHHGAIKTAAREYAGGLDTTVLERFLRNSIQPKRIVVSHGYDFTHGHPHHKSMEVYHKILKELHADCDPHYCYFNIRNCNKSNGAQYQYGWVDTAVYTTVGALDETSETPVEESKSKIVDYFLAIPKTESVSLQCADAFEPAINPLLYGPPVRVCMGFDPEALIEREEEERPEALIKKQSGQSAFASFVPPFVRER